MKRIRKVNFRLLGNFGSILMQQFNIYIISILTFGIISRLLSPTEMGVYGLIVSIVYLIGLSANFGFKKISVRLISGYHALNDEEAIRGTFWKCILLSTPVTLLVVYGVYYILSKYNIFEFVGAKEGLILFTILLLLFSFKNLIVSGLEALQLFHYESIFISLGFLIYRLLMIYFLVYGYGINGILISWIIGEIISIILIVWKTIPRYYPVTIKSEETRSLLKDAFPIFIFDIVLSATEYGDRIFTLLFGLKIVAYFYIASTGIYFLSALYQAIQGSVLPHLSREYHLNGLDGMNEEIYAISRYIFMFISPIFIVSAALAEPILVIFTGPTYLAAVPVFQIMSIGLWIGPLIPLLQSAFIAARKNNEVMIIMLISIIIDFIVMIILYPYIGYLSTGLGRATLIVAAYILLLLIGKTTLGITIDYSAYIKTVVASGITGLITWLAWIQTKNMNILPLYFALAFALYLLLLRLFKTVRPEEVLSLYISLPYKEKVKPIIKIICILTNVDYNRINQMMAKRILTEEN